MTARALLVALALAGCGGGSGSAGAGDGGPSDAALAGDVPVHACREAPMPSGPWQPVRSSGPNQLNGEPSDLILSPGGTTLLGREGSTRWFRSPDLGRTWCHLVTPKSGWQAFFAGSGDRVIYMPVLADPPPGVDASAPSLEHRFQRSDDGGETWSDPGGAIAAGAPWIQRFFSLSEDPDDLMVAANGLWRSRDGGRAWELLPEPTLNQRRYRTWVWAARHPKQPGQIYALAGTAPQAQQVDPSLELALLVSSDEGRTWSDAGPPGGGVVRSALFDAEGRLLLLRSRADVLELLPLIDLFVHEAGAGWTMATFLSGYRWSTLRRAFPGTIYLEAHTWESGEHVMLGSNDGGRSWSPRFPTAPGYPDRPVQGGTWHLAAGNGVWLGVRGHELLNSGDDGRTWTSVYLGSGADRLIAAGREIVGVSRSVAWRSTDQGRASTAIPLPPVNLVDLAVDPRDPNLQYAVTSGPPNEVQRLTLSRTSDGGRTWTRLMVDGPRWVHLVPASPSVLFVKSSSGVLRSEDGGQSLTPVDPAVRATLIRHAPSDPRQVYASDSGIWRSQDAGRSWAPGSATFAAGTLVVDPHDPLRLYVLDQDGWLSRSLDGGQTAVATPLQPGMPTRPGPRSGPFASIAVSPTRPGVVWATALRTGRALVSRDFGETWTEDTATDSVGNLAFDPILPDLLYSTGSSGTLRRTVQ